MARTLNNYRQNLNENELLIQEIGQLVKPYQSQFNFEKEFGSIFTRFKDEFGNEIKVLFHYLTKKTNELSSFEIEFTINGNSFEAFKTTTTHFFKIISTVIYSINQFIDEYKPSQMFIEGSDKIGKEGQKNKIWLQYIKVNIKDDDYVIGNYEKGIGFQKRIINGK